VPAEERLGTHTAVLNSELDAIPRLNPQASAKGFGDGELPFAADGPNFHWSYYNKTRGLLRGCTGEGEKYGGVFTELDALICALRSFPCGVTVQTFFLSIADGIPGSMNTSLAPG